MQAPRSLPRIVALPDGGARRRFVALSSIVESFVAHLFEGVQVLGCYQFRLTRNSDLFVDDEEVDDLRRALEGELAQRRYGAEVRLETAANCPADMVNFLLQQFALTPLDCYLVPGPVNLNRFSAIYDLAQRSDLKYAPFTPGLPARLVGATDLFAAIRQRDVLLHHPYRSSARSWICCARPPPILRCWRSSRRCIAPGITRRSWTRWSRLRWRTRTSPSSSSCVRASMRKPTSNCPPGCRRPART